MLTEVSYKVTAVTLFYMSTKFRVSIQFPFNTALKNLKINPLHVVVASFTEIKTGYRGFETKRNPVFRMLVLCTENYSQAYVSDYL